jgi:8-oxo-dGTP pyrophosphatase MutT (NUDIX family)
MRWTVHGERSLYESEWMQLRLVDVEVPGPRGSRFEHHVLRTPLHAAGAVVHDPERGVLLLWRHRFITDTWSWELPAGRIDPGETPEQTAAREVLEETGWRPGPLRPLCRLSMAPGISDHTIWFFLADGATHVGPPSHPEEAERIEWLTLPQLRAALANGELTDGPATGALGAALLRADL